MRYTQQNCVTEWSYHSGRSYDDPFAEVELDVVFTTPSGDQLRVPAFWAGEQTWRVRYAMPEVGTHSYRTICSGPGNEDLHGIEGELEVTPYEGDNPLLRHGALQVSEDQRYLEHADGAPFFWLGDTWWLGLCKRLTWPGDFKELVADRVAKGFSVIQIVAGLYPDMGAFDPRGNNEAGWPWEPEFARINPRYFDMADLRMDWLVSQGLVPCVLGSWGYYLPWLGVERFKQHWRYLVGRWGAYPVVWCLAGEGVMPWYLHKQTDQARPDEEIQRAGWTEVGRYLRETDPYSRPVSIHPTCRGREQVEDDSVLDFEMLQTGHGDRTSMPNTIRSVTDAYAQEPTMPVINSEVCYEGILEASREEVQRFMFWSCILSGTCGHTYGANGIWQVNEEGKPYGPSPHGWSWGDRPWREAYQLPGSGQLGLAKRLLERYEWWRLEPHPEWVEPHWTEDNYFAPYCAGIPGELRIIFLFNVMPRPVVTQLEPGLRYRAFLFNPSTGDESELGTVQGDAEGSWTVPQIEIRRDWLLVLERRGMGNGQ